MVEDCEDCEVLWQILEWEKGAAVERVKVQKAYDFPGWDDIM